MLAKGMALAGIATDGVGVCTCGMLVKEHPGEGGHAQREQRDKTCRVSTNSPTNSPRRGKNGQERPPAPLPLARGLRYSAELLRIPLHPHPNLGSWRQQAGAGKRKRHLGDLTRQALSGLGAQESRRVLEQRREEPRLPSRTASPHPSLRRGRVGRGVTRRRGAEGWTGWSVVEGT